MSVFPLVRLQSRISPSYSYNNENIMWWIFYKSLKLPIFTLGSLKLSYHLIITLQYSISVNLFELNSCNLFFKGPLLYSKRYVISSIAY